MNNLHPDINNLSPIFVTGGSGFVGSEICKLLAANKIYHTIYDRARPLFQNSYTNYIKGDIRNLDDLIAASKEHLTVIHLAAEWNDVGVSESEYRTTNIDGTKNIVQTAERNNINFIIFTSSSSVYEFEFGTNKAYREDESSDNPTTLYGQTKVSGEKLVQAWLNKSLGRTLKIVRPSVIYGPHNRGNVYNLIRQISSKFFIFPAKYDVMKSISYVENIANFFLFLLKNKTSETIYNYCDNPQMTTFELVQKIDSLLNKRSKKINSQLLLTAAYIADFFPSKIKNRFGSMKVKKFLLSTQLSNEKSFQTGFKQPITMEVGLKKTIDWILQSEQT